MSHKSYSYDAAGDIRKDAQGQFVRTREGADNDGVISAKPTVINGSEDATVHKKPDGAPPGKDWDIHYDPVDHSGG